jgi:hypothetical protein
MSYGSPNTVTSLFIAYALLKAPGADTFILGFCLDNSIIDSRRLLVCGTPTYVLNQLSVVVPNIRVVFRRQGLAFVVRSISW